MKSSKADSWKLIHWTGQWIVSCEKETKLYDEA